MHTYAQGQHVVPFPIAQANEVMLNEKSFDTVCWMNVNTDSGVVHAAIARPKGKGPFIPIIILHGSHGFAEEYVQLARKFSENGFVGIAVCWFAGRKGKGERYITPIDFNDAPPLVDVAGVDRFRISRYTIDAFIKKVIALPDIRTDCLTLFGHSRGAGASLDYLLTHPGTIKALVLNSGGYPEEVIKRVSEIEGSILLLHGSEDNPDDGGSTFTKIEIARKFESSLRTQKKNVQVKYYEGSGHNALFTDNVQFDDTVQRVSRFLRQVCAK